MTERRFEYTEYIDEDDCLNSYALITDKWTTEVYSDSFASLKRLTALLNELQEEINFGKEVSNSIANDRVNEVKKNYDLLKENEQLKQKLEDYKEAGKTIDAHIPIDEVDEIELDYRGRAVAIYYIQDDNKRLSDNLKELKQIGDYQASRIKELTEENEQLNSELLKYKAPNCRKCMEYSADHAADYCMHEKSPIGQWNMFPFKWDYEKGARECKYYDEG